MDGGCVWRRGREEGRLGRISNVVSELCKGGVRAREGLDGGLTAEEGGAAGDYYSADGIIG